MVLCDDAHIRELNQEWRDKDAATDVLSFPMDDDMPEGYPIRILGDVVISLETAQRQAEERGCVPPPPPPPPGYYFMEADGTSTHDWSTTQK